ncbi:MAG: hypothetical protein NPIRA01_15670 [Nitrospirales bacterium]|nr:MAG: hypothetical protein NPIRA01_15670 [Nitrospirales bacterium]
MLNAEFWCTMRFRSALLSVTILTATLVGCDPQEAIQRYFAGKGLNPLAILRTDITPGTLIIVGEDGTPHLRGHLSTYATQEEAAQKLLPVSGCGTASGCTGILSGYQEDRSLTFSAAFSFFQGLLQWNPTVDLGFTGKVKIDQIHSYYEKIEPAHVDRFFTKREARPATQFVLGALKDKERAFVVYEVHRSDRMQISSADGTDIAPSLTVGTAPGVPIEGKVSVTYKKISKDELLVSTNQPYAFAVKTGELLPNATRDTVRFKVTKPIEAETTIKGKPVKGPCPQSTDACYAQPLMPNFEAVTFADN